MAKDTDWPYMIFDESGNALGAYSNWWSAHWAWFKLKLRYPRYPFFVIGPN